MYNIGQNRFFVLLAGKEYTTSKAFDATDVIDLKQIINAPQKAYFINRLKPALSADVLGFEPNEKFWEVYKNL